jgi:hypothetical protein
LSYENIIKQQITAWIPVFLKPPGFFEKTSKKISTKINTWIPQKVHNAITLAVKTIVRTTLFGAEYTPKGKVQLDLTLEEADMKAKDTLSLYQKIATAEGAGTGAGGFLLNVVDFPALIAIKLKLLFELAHVYGYNTMNLRNVFLFSPCSKWRSPVQTNASSSCIPFNIGIFTK